MNVPKINVSKVKPVFPELTFDTFFYSLYCCLFIFYERQVYWADA